MCAYSLHCAPKMHHSIDDSYKLSGKQLGKYWHFIYKIITLKVNEGQIYF